MEKEGQKADEILLLERRKKEIIDGLLSYGIQVDNDGNCTVSDKRAFMRMLAENVNPKPDPKTSVFFASSFAEVDVKKIEPELELVESEESSRIFRHACSFWSVPVSCGFGRRMRFILWDRGNKKVMGIFGLCDPVINLNVRDDELLAWDKQQKMERLYNIMTAYVLGAVYPLQQVSWCKAGRPCMRIKRSERNVQKKVCWQKNCDTE
ncbi:MAG TPA: hypothetical protein DEA47_01030 [Peptococcaceae bacterium]|nr:MAG: Uncharacterized protein XD50_0281 [Clostridia bacterium 41_269]HBT19948.1 hypothetical protein [Peptococcaceae bacterium]